MRTIVALWHAFWQSFEIERYENQLLRALKARRRRES